MTTTPHHTPRVVSIAGTDPTGGAGIHADLKSIAALGGYGMGAVTAVVAQNTMGVRDVHQLSGDCVVGQLAAISDDVTIDAVKIGMLGSAEVMQQVAGWLAQHHTDVVVLDPVMVATSGDLLIDESAVADLRRLFDAASIITPNVPEMAQITGDAKCLDDWDVAVGAAIRVADEHQVRVLLKGGHSRQSQAVDALIEPGCSEPVAQFSVARVATNNTHGTGCSLSSGLATVQAQMQDWVAAIRCTKAWLTHALVTADQLDVGHGHGPINHGSYLWQTNPLGIDVTTVTVS